MLKNKFIHIVLYVIILLIPFLLQANELQYITNYCSKLLNIRSDNLHIEKFNAGVGNHVYLLSTNQGDHYVAKVFTKRSLDSVYQIENIISDLRDQGFKIPQTLAVTSLPDTHPLQISAFDPGSHVTDHDLEKVATLMAKLHTHGSSIHSMPQEKYKNNEHYQNLFKKCEDWIYTEPLKKIYDNLPLDYLAQLPKGLIHGDFSYTNLLKSSNDELTLIDFDHVCTSHLLTDVVRCQMFYGFDTEGNLEESKIKNFVANYNLIRPLAPIEMENFYTHMTLMMIDTALEMYYHIYIAQDLPLQTVSHLENKTLIPEILAKKILNIKDKNKLIIEENIISHGTPLIFFGKSGAGKTEMIHGIVNLHPDLFYIPIFTCTRAPREDDHPSYFEYISVEKFLQLDQEKAFLFTMHEGERYYGYRKSHLNQLDKYPLINCSPYGLNNAPQPGIFVLVDGDSEMGLKHRNNSQDYFARSAINKKLSDEFYNQNWFTKQMDIIHFNEWGKKEDSIWQLSQKILEKLGLLSNDRVNYRAA